MCTPTLESCPGRFAFPQKINRFHAKYNFSNAKILFRAYGDVLRALDWQQFTIVYENDDSLERINDILTNFDQREYSLALRQLENVNGSYRGTLVRMKNSGTKRYVLDCSLETLEVFLVQALQVGLVNENYNYLITNLDVQTLNLEPYQYGGSNITGVNL